MAIGHQPHHYGDGRLPLLWSLIMPIPPSQHARGGRQKPKVGARQRLMSTAEDPCVTTSEARAYTSYVTACLSLKRCVRGLSLQHVLAASGKKKAAKEDPSPLQQRCGGSGQKRSFARLSGCKDGEEAKRLGDRQTDCWSRVRPVSQRSLRAAPHVTNLPPDATAYSDSKRGGPSSVLTCLWLEGKKEEVKGFAPNEFSLVLQPENCSCGSHLQKKLLPAGWKKRLVSERKASTCINQTSTPFLQRAPILTATPPSHSASLRRL